MANYMTKKTYERLSARLKHLIQVESIELSKEIAVAREKGDLRENAEYDMAKHKQSLVQIEIGELKEALINVQYIDDLKVPGDRISLATTVKVKDMADNKVLTYAILGPHDSDAENGCISFQSPIARGLIGQKAGDEVTVPLPAGPRKFKILAVEPYKP